VNTNSQSGDERNNVHMPMNVWTIPNAISFARLLGIPLIVVFGLDPDKSVLAFAVFVVGGFTDWLDGYLARRLNQMSKIGAALDPIADRLYIITAVIVLLIRDMIPLWVVVLVVARDVMMAGHLLRTRRSGFAPPPVHYIGKAATMLLLYSVPLIFLGGATFTLAEFARWTGLAFLIWGVVVYWIAGLLYIAQFKKISQGT
jgi:cardiolipin synthase